MADKVDRVIAEARAAAQLLESLGERRAAEAVLRLCLSRTMARETNARLWKDNQALRRQIAGEG